MIHADDAYVRDVLLHGQFGLERESLRLTQDGRFSHAPHPFPGDENIVRDFSENQTEINTTTHRSIDGAMKELTEVDRRLKAELARLPEPEVLWPFSNPPVIRGEYDIPIAQFYGTLQPKTAYREYLSDKYGRFLMTYSGVHVNFSFSEELLARDRKVGGIYDPARHKNRLYLDLAKNLLEYGWILTAVTAASPLLDRSFYDPAHPGETIFSGMASCRCSELGYWNDFVPTLDYSGLEEYGKSILRYVEEGWLYQPAELYYPIRLKSYGQNDVRALMEKGVSHIELRMFDLNPFTESGVDQRDVQFAHLLMVYLSSIETVRMNKLDQIRAAANFKKAAHFDLSIVKYVTPSGRSVPMEEAALSVVESMQEFYRDFPDEIRELLRFEAQKFRDPTQRLAYAVREQFGEDFFGKGLAYSKERQNSDVRIIRCQQP